MRRKIEKRKKKGRIVSFVSPGTGRERGGETSLMSSILQNAKKEKKRGSAAGYRSMSHNEEEGT